MNALLFSPHSREWKTNLQCRESRLQMVDLFWQFIHSLITLLQVHITFLQSFIAFFENWFCIEIIPQNEMQNEHKMICRTEANIRTIMMQIRWSITLNENDLSERFWRWFGWFRGGLIGQKQKAKREEEEEEVWEWK